MEGNIKKLTNEELLQLYRLIVEHIEFLQNEKKKLEVEEEEK